MVTRRIVILTLFVVAVGVRTVAAQAMSEFWITYPVLLLADGTNGEHANVVLVLSGHFHDEIPAPEDPCRYMAATVTVEDPKGIAAPTETFVEFIPGVQEFVDLSVDMHGDANSVRLLKMSDVQKRGDCVVRAAGNVADADGSTAAPVDLGIIGGSRFLYSSHGGGAVPPRAGQGVVLGSALQNERHVFTFVLIDNLDLFIPPTVDPGTPPAHCDSLSLQVVLSEPTNTVMPQVFEFDLNVDDPIAEVEAPFSHYGGTIEYRIVVANGNGQGSCALHMAGRQLAEDRSTIAVGRYGLGFYVNLGGDPR